MRQGLVLSLCCLAGLCGAPVRALEPGALSDPTRPPASLAGATRAEGGAMLAGAAPGAAARPASGSSAVSARAARPRLTLIRMDAYGRGVALIDGRLLSIGDRVGDAVLASMDAQGVVLRSAKGWQRLPLIAPSAPQRAVTPPVAAPEREEKESP